MGAENPQITHETTRETSGASAARCEATARASDSFPSRFLLAGSGSGPASHTCIKWLDASKSLDVPSGHVPRGARRRPTDVRPTGRPPSALAAADRARRQRLPGSRAGRRGSTSRRTWSPTTCGCCATADWSPPRAAASTAATATTTWIWTAARMRWPTPVPRCTRRCAGTRPADPAGRAAAVSTHRRAVRVHRQQRPLTDRRSPAAPPHRRSRDRDERREPAQARPAPEHRPRAARDVRHRHRRPAPAAPGHRGRPPRSTT